jgi:Fic family protein
VLFKTPTLDDQERKILDVILQLKRELDFMTAQPVRWTGSLRRDTFARAIRGSNSIEGYELSLHAARAVAEREEPLGADEEAVAATAGYRAAMTLVLQKEDDPYFTYSYEFLNSLHFMMVGYDLNKNPGRWRPGAVFVHDEERDLRVYEGPSIEVVPSLMVELMASLNSPGETHPIVAAAMAHLNFVMIHPHSDGNGRMARCLQTLVLARGRMGRNPIFVSIEEYLGANTPAYYKALEEVGGGSWHPENDTKPWIRLCLTAHYRQARTMKARAELWSRIFSAVEEVAKRRKLHERYLVTLAEATYGFHIRNATHRSSADVTEAIAGRDLKEMVDAGLLVPHGEKRGRYYTRGPTLEEVAKAIEVPPRPGDPFEEIHAGQTALPFA